MSVVQIPTSASGYQQSVITQANAAQRAVNRMTMAPTLNPKGITQPLGKITASASEFQKSMDASAARVFAFGAAVGIINGISSAFKNMIDSAREVEKALKDVQVVMAATNSEMAQFGQGIFDVAKNTASSFQVVSESAIELARQGLGAEETLKRVNSALILSRLSGLNAVKSTETLTAAINSFNKEGITHEQVVNRMANVDAAFAVSSKDLAEAISRAGAVAQSSGVSFNELAAIVTAVQQRTARGGSVIGNGFKSIFTRIKRSGVREALEEIGVATKDVQGNFRSGIAILKDYANVYKTLTDSQKAYTSEQVAGVFQIQNLQALIQDLGSGYSVYDKSLKVANETTNEAIVRNERLNETLDAIFKSTTLSAKQLGATLGEIALSDSFKNILQFLGNLADGLNNLFDEKTGSDFARNLVKGIGSFITGPGLVILGAAFIKLFALIGKFAKDAFKDLLGLNLESKRQASLQTAITASLSQNSSLMKAMVAAGSNQAKQEQIILNFIRQETAERLKQEAIIKRIASSGALRGIGASEVGFVPGGRRSSRRAGRATLGIAGGFIPAFNEEARNIKKGVGGARSGDKPVGVTVGLGGGKKMNAVAHTGEWRVPWGGGSEAIFNRDMASEFGLPKGSKKITAGSGFVPNFAKGKKSSASSRATTLDFSRLVTMLIPQKSNKGFATSQWKDKSGGLYNVKFQVKGPDASAVKRVDPMINKMANSGILGAAGKAANKLGKNEFNPGPGPKSLSNSELAVTKGRIFEVATARVLKAPKFVKDQATFDLMNPDTNRANLFNWNTPFADAKTGPQHAKSVAGKIVNFFGSGGGKGKAMGAKPVKDLMAQINKDEVKGFRGKQAERSRLSILNRLSEVGITPGVGGRVGAFGKSLQGQAAQAGKEASFRKNVLGHAGGFIPNFAPFSLSALTGRQIGRLKAGNTLNINGKHLGAKDLSSKDQTALLGHQSKSSKAAAAASANKQKELKSRQLVDASRFATMLVATRNHRAKVDRAVDRGDDKYRVRFRVEGIKKAGLIGEKKIRKRVRDVLVKESNRAAQDMVGPGDFAKNLPVMTNVMNAGALGGAAGTVFETALQAIQGNKLFKDNDNNARFDIQGFPNNKLSGMFGYHTQLGEAKISDTSDQRTSMINKILSQKSKFGVKPAGGKTTFGKQKAAARVARGLSGGFIPNFARGGFGLSAYRKRIGEESKKIASTSGLRYGKALSRREFMGSGAENLVFAGRKNVFKVNPGTLRGSKARDTMGGESSSFQSRIQSSSARAKNFNKLVSKRYPAVFSPRTKGFKMGKGTLNVQGRVRGPTLQQMVDGKLITKQEALMLTDVIGRASSKAVRGAGYPSNYPLVDSHLVNFVIPESKVRSVVRSLREGRRLSDFPRKSIAAIDVAKGFIPNFSGKSRAMEMERAMGGNPGYREDPFPHVYDKDTQPTWQKTFNDHKSEGLSTAIQNSYNNQMGMSGGFTPNLMPRGGNTNWEMVSPRSKKSIDEFAADYDSTGALPGPKDKFEGGRPMEASLGRQLGSQFIRRFEKLRSMGWRKRTPGEHREFVSKWSKVKDKLNTKKKWLKYGLAYGFMPNFASPSQILNQSRQQNPRVGYPPQGPRPQSFAPPITTVTQTAAQRAHDLARQERAKKALKRQQRAAQAAALQANRQGRATRAANRARRRPQQPQRPPGRIAKAWDYAKSAPGRVMAANERFSQSPKAMGIQMGAMMMLPMLAEQIKANKDGRGQDAGSGAAKGAAMGAAYGSFFGLPGMAIGAAGGAIGGAMSGSKQTLQPIIEAVESLGLKAQKASDSVNLTATAISGLQEATLSGDIEKMQTAQDKLQESLRKVGDPELASRLRDVATGAGTFSEKIAELNKLFDDSESKKQAATSTKGSIELLDKINEDAGVRDFSVASRSSDNSLVRAWGDVLGSLSAIGDGISGAFDDTGTNWSGDGSGFKDGLTEGRRAAREGEVISGAKWEAVGESFADSLALSGLGRASGGEFLQDKLDNAKKHGMSERELAQNLMKSMGLGKGLSKDFGVEDLKKNRQAMLELSKRSQDQQLKLLEKEKRALNAQINVLSKPTSKANIDTVKRAFLKTESGKTLGKGQQADFMNLENQAELKNFIKAFGMGVEELVDRSENLKGSLDGLAGSSENMESALDIASKKYKDLTRSIEEMSVAIELFSSRVKGQMDLEKAMSDSNFDQFREINNILESVGGITGDQNEFRQRAISGAQIEDSSRRDLEAGIFDIITNAIDPTAKLFNAQRAVENAAEVKRETEGPMGKIQEQNEAADRKYTQELTDNFNTLIMQGGRENVTTQNMLRVVQMTGSKEQQLASQGLRVQNAVKMRMEQSIREQIQQKQLLQKANDIAKLRSAAEDINKWGSNVISGESVNNIVRDFNDAAQTGPSGSRTSGAAAEARNRTRDMFGPEIINKVFNTTGLEDKLAIVAANLEILRDVAIGEGDTNMVATVDRLAARLGPAGELLLQAGKSMDQIMSAGPGGLFDPDIAALKGVMSENDRLLSQQLRSSQAHFDLTKRYYQDMKTFHTNLPTKLADVISMATPQEVPKNAAGVALPDSLPADTNSNNTQSQPQANITPQNIVQPLVDALTTTALNINPETLAPIIESATGTNELLGGLTKNINDYMGNLKNIVYEHGVTGNMRVEVDTAAVQRWLGPLLTQKVKDILGNSMIIRMIAEQVRGMVTLKDTMSNP